MTATANAPEFDMRQLRERLAQGDGRQLWRSLDELAQTAEFRAQIEREFPSQLAVWDDPLGRRRFLQLMAASLGLAGLGTAGCTRPPQEKIVPYVRAPEEIVPGRPLFYATAVLREGYAQGVLVESHEGRPTKVEGNPQHPWSMGATDAFAQASILSLYDPDRSQTVMHRGVISTWDRLFAALAAQRERWQASGGAGLRILSETITSPTLVGQLHRLLDQLPSAVWRQFQPAGRENVQAGTRLVLGRDADVLYHFDRARIVVSLDSDFLGAGPTNVRYARQFMGGRTGPARRAGTMDGGDSLNRLYVIESTPTITGAMADHRLPLAPSQIAMAAQSLAGRLDLAIPGLDVATSPALPSSVPETWLNALAEDLHAHRGQSLVLTGPGQPPAIHALALALNEALGNLDKTLTLIEPVAPATGDATSLAALVAEMRAAQVETLVILGGNPAYAAPAALGFAEALAQVPERIHLSEEYNETSLACDWHLPAAHYLESWGDARAPCGLATIVQPLIEPLYGGKTAHELMAVVAGSPTRSPNEIVQAHWKEQLGEADFGQVWRKALHDGVVEGSQSPAVQAELSLDNLAAALGELSAPASREGQVEIEIRPDLAVGDGRWANNAWLQELPRPLTKITWDNVALVSPATAERLRLTSGTMIEVAVGERTVVAPVWVLPGQSDDCISLSLGYGRTKSGRVGTGLGYSAARLQPASGAWFTFGTVRATGERRRIATTQDHYRLEGRDIVRVTTPAQLPGEVLPTPQADFHASHELPSLYPQYDDSSGNAWGMVIDQTACTGCNACVVACQAENNIPVVGRDEVLVGREMHWLRIDRYFVGGLDNPETYFQPMLCQHCELAPCEIVCPVMATVHDSEGTSNMIYNRCVGTRYCSNNCPYKVRRFNYLQYTDETTPSLKLLRNPDVTVRSRGVMEKCSYCIQRISAARIEAKIENRPIRDGEVVTACQQACPTQAIVFGNLNDPQAAVAAQKRSPLNYSVLGELNTKPRTTYLARVVNPHPSLPAPAAVAATVPVSAHEVEP